jgi:membrane-bound lytic murein transglycosylase A
MKTCGVCAVLTLLGAVLLCGCPKKPTGTLSEPIPAPPEYSRPLPEGQLALRKITDPAEIPDFTPACADLTSLREALARSISYMSKPSSRRYFPYGEITHAQALASLNAFAALLEGSMTAPQMNAAIRERFDVYTSVGWDGSGTVLFTGYYTPIFDASLTPTERFRYPLYKEPPNLAKGEEGTILGIRGAGGQLTRCPARQELEGSPLLKGCELAYLADPFEVYVAQVQGSAKLRLPDGRLITVGYSANNGYDYNSVALELVKDGKIARESLSLQAMMDYFRAHPGEVGEYVRRNPRFVFFSLTDGNPRGSLNEPVTTLRTIATDKAIFPRACLAFVSTQLPRANDGAMLRPYRGFALDQDTGGAIRAAGRCDVYMGIGPAAAELAGRTQQEGRLYYLFLKPAMLTTPALPAMTEPPPAPAAKP